VADANAAFTFDDLDYASGAHGAIRIRSKEADGEFWEPNAQQNNASDYGRLISRKATRV
jgi:hypothetical protein